MTVDKEDVTDSYISDSDLVQLLLPRYISTATALMNQLHMLQTFYQNCSYSYQ